MEVEGSATGFTNVKTTGAQFELRKVVGNLINNNGSAPIEILISNVYASDKQIKAFYNQGSDLYLFGGRLSGSQGVYITKISVIEVSSNTFDVGSKIVIMGRRHL